jgi:hypothetical protein
MLEVNSCSIWKRSGPVHAALPVIPGRPSKVREGKGIQFWSVGSQPNSLDPLPSPFGLAVDDG